MKRLNSRELGLISVLLGTLFISVFVILHIQPLRNQLITLKKDKQKVQKKINKEKSNVIKKGSLLKLKKSLSELKAQTKLESKTMAGYQQSFIDLQQYEKQADLKAEITHLIEVQGLTITDIGEESQSLDKLVNTQTKASTQDIKRPMIGLELTGDFTMLNNFIQQLESLSNSVVITRLSLTVERDKDLRAPYVLSTQLSLAL